jgi:phosphoribosylaminoimidazole-succinocarboxamide synthase
VLRFNFPYNNKKITKKIKRKKMKNNSVITKTTLPFKLFARGKVRDIYDLGEGKLLMISTDRISAFDWVLPNGIPYKGKVLNSLSVYWFHQTEDIIKNHLISSEIEEFPAKLHEFKDMLEGRSMLVKKTKRVDVECVARGYLAGSAWSEYKETGSIGGISLSKGLQKAEKLTETIFTPAIKAEEGHDENISEERLEKIVGKELKEQLKYYSLRLYERASKILEKKGIILADTKFEFGFLGEELILIDEILTPDSSRFWAEEDYAIGVSPPSLDKQFVRDYLETTEWDKNSEPPELPEEIVKKTTEKYLEIYERITGRKLE